MFPKLGDSERVDKDGFTFDIAVENLNNVK